MGNWQLTPELERLERDLAVRPRLEPSAEWQQWLMHSVRSELRRAQSNTRWAFALAVAATVLVWLNLSLSATQATDCGFAPIELKESIAAVAQEIRQLLPELSAEEAMRQAILLRAGSSILPCPRLPAGAVGHGLMGNPNEYLAEEHGSK